MQVQIVWQIGVFLCGHDAAFVGCPLSNLVKCSFRVQQRFIGLKEIVDVD